MCHTNRHFLWWLPAMCSVAIVLVATSSGAQVTPPKPGGTLAARKVVLPTTDELMKKGPKVAVETVAEVLGMVRGPSRNTTSVNVVEVVASGTVAERDAEGTWRDYKVTRLTEAVDFVIPAARLDVERSGPGGPQRQIQVVAGTQAWDEEKPGINGTPVAGATADRIRMIWLTPQGAMWGALRAAEGGGNVQLANEGGRLAISYSLNGEPVKLVFNANLLPEKVQIQARSATYGDTTLEATYAEYKEFGATQFSPEGFLAPCPSRITYTAGGRRIRELTVNDCEINPYVIFPVPANMAKTSTTK